MSINFNIDFFSLYNVNIELKDIDMKDYLKQVAPRNTTTSSPLSGRNDMVVNNSSGYVFNAGDFERVERFLILGSEGGSYYAGQQDLTKQNVDCIWRALDEDAFRVIGLIREISKSGRAPKNDPALFALAMASAYGLNRMGSPASSDWANAVRRSAYEAVQDVCRTSTHLFTYLSYSKLFRGMGSGLRKAISKWYLDKGLDSLAYQAIKYRKRSGWTHGDVLRLVRPNPRWEEQSHLFKWMVGKRDGKERLPQIIYGYEKAQDNLSARELSKVIREYRLPREAVPNQFLKESVVWDALLDDMPMTAMIRNLGNMTKVGLLTMGSNGTNKVVRKLRNEDAIRKSKIHPLQILMALTTYGSGEGFRGSGHWVPVSQIIDALDEAYLSAFKNVTPTNKRLFLALDCSASMEWGNIAGSNMTPRQGAGAMAMAAARTEPHYMTYGFTSSGGGWGSEPRMDNLGITGRQRLDDVVRKMGNIPWGGTDCSLPMRYALDRGIEVDAFIVYTDNETNSNKVHPCIALREYRQKMGIDAKLVVVGMVSNGFSIADPEDFGTLDVVGFDSAAPALIADFIR